MIRKAYELYASKFGNKAQMIKAIEELSELQKAIAKFLLGESDAASIIEEIADVEVMTEQLKLMFNCHNKVDRIKKEKIQRMLDRLK